MKQYKVIAGICPMVPQREHLNAGEIRDEDYFHDGQISDLVRRGFIEEVTEEPAKEEPAKVAKAK